MSIADVERLFVWPFTGDDRAHRERLFHGLEQAIQQILTSRLRCQICLDGSFLTKKPKPDDIDIVVCIDSDVADALDEPQRQIIDLINSEHDFFKVDSTAFFNYPRDHECFGCALDAQSASEGFGLEHGQRHLKGYVVLRLWETDVGLRICR